MEPWIDGIPVTEYGSYGDVEYSETRQGGCDSATWKMNRTMRRHTRFRPGATIQIKDQADPVFTGRLAQPDDSGQFTAYGYATLGSGVLALDGAGAATTNPDTAIFHAINTRGDVPWNQPASLYGAPIGDTEVDLTLNRLLDRYSSFTGIPWRVDHNGQIVGAPTPTDPSWAVQISDDTWTLVDENYVTHLNVVYFSPALVDAYVTVTTTESAAAAAKWHKVVKTLDIRGEGIVTLANAQTWGASVLARTGPRLHMVKPIILAPGQLRNLGDVPAGWTGVHAGQKLRLWGVPDRTQVIPTLHTDVVIGRVHRTRSTLTLTPDGARGERFEDVVAEMFGQAA